MPDEGALRTIAVATDFSRNAMPAFAWALELAQRHHLELVLVRTRFFGKCARARLSRRCRSTTTGRCATRRTREARALMARSRPAGLSISLELVVGSTAAGVVAAAERQCGT